MLIRNGSVGEGVCGIIAYSFPWELVGGNLGASLLREFTACQTYFSDQSISCNTVTAAFFPPGWIAVKTCLRMLSGATVRQASGLQPITPIYETQ